MITINITNHFFIISHYKLGSVLGAWCIFHKDFLSKKMQQNIYSLPLFKSKKYFGFKLNLKQNGEVEYIMQKMKDEENSGYVFSADLERTYLLELIHFLMKIYQLNNTVLPACSN